MDTDGIKELLYRVEGEGEMYVRVRGDEVLVADRRANNGETSAAQYLEDEIQRLAFNDSHAFSSGRLPSRWVRDDDLGRD